MIMTRFFRNMSYQVAAITKHFFVYTPGLGGVLLGVLGSPAFAESPTITLFHTNDLHSRFRPDKGPLGLGGIARMKTLVSRLRKQSPSSLLVDSGDWSEGSAHYLSGAGRKTLQLMDSIGYDVAVIGNHDWLNGPDHLLSILRDTRPKLTAVAANVSLENYPQAEEFKRLILPYSIKTLPGAPGQPALRVAFIGVLTYEFIYDGYLKPIKIEEPFAVTRELATRLRKKADVVVALSHNGIKLNQSLLKAAPELDGVIGAHDHAKLTQAIEVERAGAPNGWLVEAGSWGRYLGEVQLRVDPTGLRRPELLKSQLHLINSESTEDPAIVAQLDAMEAQIERDGGPSFHDHVAACDFEVSREGLENFMGSFTTDAYRAALNADIAIDHTNFISGELHQGSVTSADLFNANPGVYNPVSKKAWTLYSLPIQGKTLKWLLNFLYSLKGFSEGGSLNFSGSDLVFDPIRARTIGSLNDILKPRSSMNLFSQLSEQEGWRDAYESAEESIVKTFRIGGEEVQPERFYLMATPGSIVESLRLLNTYVPNAVPLDQLRDTGEEDWRVMKKYLTQLQTLSPEKIQIGSRIRTFQCDLGLRIPDISWKVSRSSTHANNGTVQAKIQVVVRNSGLTPSVPGSSLGGPHLSLLLNERGADTAQAPVFHAVGESQPIPALFPGESITLSWDAISLTLSQGVYPLTIRIDGSVGEANTSNDEITQYFQR